MRATSLNNRFTLISLFSIVLLSSVFVLIFFPLQTTISYWNGYRILITDLAVPEEDILLRLSSVNITDIVTESNAYIENRSVEAPIQPFLAKINVKRAVWFINPIQKYRFLYIKEIPFLNTKISEAFRNVQFFWDYEKPDKISVLPSLLSFLLLCSGVFIVSGNRAFLLSGLPLVFLPFSCNQPSGFAASVLALFSLILYVDIIGEKGRHLTVKQIVTRIKYQKYAWVPFVSALLAAFSGGFHSAMLFISSLCALFSLFFFTYKVNSTIKKLQIKRRLHPVFESYVMHPETIKRSFSRHLILALSSITVIFFIGGIVFFSVRISGKSSFPQDLYIPAPSEYTAHSGLDLEGYMELRLLKDEKCLPDLTDFLASQWLLYSFPYRRIQELGKEPTKDSVTEYYDYDIDATGYISSKKKIMYEFDNNFIKKRLALDSTPLEKMLIRQNRFVTVIQRKGPIIQSIAYTNLLLLAVLCLLVPGVAILMRIKK